MLSGIAKTGLALLLSALAFEACSTPAEKSTGTNWIVCKTDADCEGRPGTRCSKNERCEPDGDVGPDASSSGDGGASGSAGTTGTGGTRGGTGGTGGATGGESGAGGTGGATGGAAGDGAGGAGGATGGAAGDGAGGLLETGGQATGGQGGFGGSGGGPIHAEGCYSPGQNLETSFIDPEAFGCKCIESQTPDGLCLKTPNNGIGAYLCESGHWKADTNNTACTGCWTPDQPEFANARPDNGCACVNENETACIVTQNEGYTNAVCRGGKWKLDPALSSCACAKDARCGFGGKCVGQTCASRVCEVDGVRYAVGVSFPSPSDACNSCKCDTSGQLNCTTQECPETACPTGTVQASTCVGCGLGGGCGLWRFGCLPRCERDADCARTGTPVCDATNHVCSAGPCI
jgi:hypothetical protein